MQGRIFSGIQPTSGIHLGNYLGAIRHWVRLQAAYDCIYCLVDQHALTALHDAEQMRANTREAAAALIAAGVDPHGSILFAQSSVPAHAQLAWVLSCVSPIGWLNRMTQFKEKAGKDRENAPVGLYTYPVLMAADILAYQATHVPVGEDQKQHLELARDVAGSFNRRFGVDLFPLPEPMILGEATRVMSLRDGTKKMSKSDPSDQSRINLTDDADTIAAKIRKAKTDPEPLPESPLALRDRPEAKNLVNIYAALAGQTVEQVIAEYAGAQFGTFKPKLAELAVARLSPITTEMNRLMKDPAEIDRILGKGADRADAIAHPILEKTYDILGMIRSRGR